MMTRSIGRAGGMVLTAGVLLSGMGAEGSFQDFSVLPQSVQQAGGGNVSILATDVLASWSNPAWLALTDSRVTGTLGGGVLFGSEESDFAGGGSYTLDPWRGALMVSRFGLSFPEVSPFGEPTGAAVEQSSLGLGAVVAARWNWFGVGVAFKHLSSSVAKVAEASTAGDVGVCYVPGSFRVGLSAGNLYKTGLPLVLRAGAAYRVQAWRAAFGAELNLISYGRPEQAGISEVGLGAEWRAIESVAFRAGVGGIGDQIRLTFGLSAYYRDFRLDYAFGSHPLGMTNRFSMSYVLGQARKAGERGSVTGEGTPAEATSAPRSSQPATSADSLFQEASSLYAAADYAGAWGKAVDALKVDPRHWQSWQMIGNCQYALGDKAGAMTSYGASLQLNPDNPGLKTWLDQQPQ